MRGLGKGRRRAAPRSGRGERRREEESFTFSAGYKSRLLQLPRLLARGRGGEEGASGQLRGGRVEFHDHRPYVSGDDPRDIDWSLYLRLKLLMVKQYSRAESPQVMVILDRSASMGPFPGGKDRLAREVAGGLLYSSLAAGSEARLLLLARDRLVRAGTWHGARSLEALLSTLETLDPPAGVGSLMALLKLFPPPPRGRLILLLSDFLEDPLPSSPLAALARGGGGGVLLHLVSRAERAPLLDAASALLDPESGQSLPVGEARALEAGYQRELAAHEEALRGLAGAHGLRYMLLGDEAPFEVPVLAVLGGGKR